MKTCDLCGQNKENVKMYVAGGEVKTKEAEYKIRDKIESLTDKKIVGFPKLCTECFLRFDVPRLMREK